jgi:hypothetical protein
MKPFTAMLIGSILILLNACGSDTTTDQAGPASTSETGNAYTDSLKESRDAASTAADALEEAARKQAEAAEQAKEAAEAGR